MKPLNVQAYEGEPIQPITFTRSHPTPVEWPRGFKTAICIRVDVETVNCLLRGVPNLLELFDKYSFKATFFVPMGPDCLGRNFKTSDLTRYLRLVPLKKFGLKNLLYGLLLPPPEMGKHRSELTSIAEHGHEVGLHGYNHAEWARSLHLPQQDTEKMFLKGYNEFTEIFGKRPKAFSSPEFKTTEHILSMLDRYDFLYGSDSRRQTPFWPKNERRTFETLQVPVTMPNLEELSWRGMSDREALKHVYSELEKKIEFGGLAVFLIHPSYEGLWKRSLFSALLNFIDRRRDELWITTMEEVTRWWLSQAR